MSRTLTRGDCVFGSTRELTIKVVVNSPRVGVCGYDGPAQPPH
ncbi:MAG: hypothetical protein ACP5UQ_08730 [Anaerolineae bacterium]